MILYFASEYSTEQQYPSTLLDPNIASDYNKIRKSFKIKGKEKEHLKHLNTLLKTGILRSNLVHLYDLERKFDTADFISLLYYQGIITIWDSIFDLIEFKIPNYVIKQLYFQYFHQIILEENNMEERKVDIYEKIVALAKDNNLKPLIEYTEAILQELAVRDKMNFDEKYIKTIFTSAFHISGIYTIFNEFEVKKSETDKGFVDLLLLQRKPYYPNYQFVIEFKYVKKQDASQAEKVKKQAISQLKTYLQNDEYLQGLKDLKAYVVIFVGNKGEIVSVNI